MTKEQVEIIAGYEAVFHEIMENSRSVFSPAMLEARQENFLWFSKNGFPATTDEEWRFTHIAPLTSIKFSCGIPAGISEPAINTCAHVKLPGARIALVNGMWDNELSELSQLPKGVVAGSLRQLLLSKNPAAEKYCDSFSDCTKNAFTALNSSFFTDGVFLYIPDGHFVSEPIEILSVAAGGEDVPWMLHPRIVIVLGKGSKCSIVETDADVSEAKYFSNESADLHLGESAELEYIRIGEGNPHSFHFASLQARMAAKSNLELFSFSAGGRIARNDLDITIAGAEATASVNGLFITSGDQTIDHHTLIDHTQPNCSSREIFRGILTDRSHGVFNGKIMVRQKAQKTDSKQANKNLLLSNAATIDTKPQLEIFADDVKCTHGATVGGLNQASLFYLNSRGIGEETARGMLTAGFASEATQFISDPSLRRMIDDLAIQYLKKKTNQSGVPQIVHQEIRP